jgi:hypothetical protein
MPQAIRIQVIAWKGGRIDFVIGVLHGFREEAHHNLGVCEEVPDRTVFIVEEP